MYTKMYYKYRYKNFLTSGIYLLYVINEFGTLICLINFQITQRDYFFLIIARERTQIRIRI